jgi:predicted chitinase
LGASGEIVLSGQSKIHLNGPAAQAADSASNSETPSLLPLYKVPSTDSSVGWSNGKYYQADPLVTIMQRVPMHEPWVQHENVAPTLFTPSKTDVSLISRPDVIASNPNAPDVQETPANVPASLPGTCTTTSIKAISTADAQSGIAALKAACAEAGITSPYAVASILGIAGGESAWIPQKEGYSYSASALQSVFPKTFRGKPELAEKYARWKGTRESFFDFVYAPENNGGGLGNTQPADGGKFYGRGFIQLTGRANYTKYGKLAGVDLVNNPELLNSDYNVSAKVAVAYFKDRVKKSQDDSMYFDSALPAIGGARDGWTKKRDYYNCFLANLQGATVGTGTGGVLTDGQGNPVKSGGVD